MDSSAADPFHTDDLPYGYALLLGFPTSMREGIPEISAAQKALLFELPFSMEAVRNQKAGIPYDSANPLYSFGFGVPY